MDNSTSPDLEKGIARQDTQNSEGIARLGHSSSPQSTSWSIRQLIRSGTGSCKFWKCRCLLLSLIVAASGENPVSPKRWFWSRSTTENETSQNEFPEDDEERDDTENIVRRRQ
jgi:hypothetical protein